MDRSLTIPDVLYEKLEDSASRRGLKDIKQLLEEWQAIEEEHQRHHEAAQQIKTLRKWLHAKYGGTPDSTEAISEDRER